jgi:hypothetical protein
MRRLDRDQLALDLEAIALIGRAAFAAAAAERLLPAYLRYCDDIGYDRDLKLRKALHCVWRHVEVPSTNREELQREHDIAYALTHAPEEPFSEFLGYAQNASAAVTYCLRFLLGDDEKGAVRAAWHAHDAAYQWAVFSMVEGIRIVTAADMESYLSHALVQTELARQRRDLLDLKSAAPDQLSATVAILRARAERESVVPIGVK